MQQILLSGDRRESSRKFSPVRKIPDMTFEEFQQNARLYVLGALDEEEMVSFEEGRRQFGATAEEFILECRELNAAFALSLRPQPPKKDARERLLEMVHRSQREKRDRTQQGYSAEA
jgi:hypothetical protein